MRFDNENIDLFEICSEFLTEINSGGSEVKTLEFSAAPQQVIQNFSNFSGVS